MKENVGELDRNLRLVIGTILIVTGLAGYAGAIKLAYLAPQAVSSLALLVIGVILVVTGIRRKCLIYKPFGIET